MKKTFILFFIYAVVAFGLLTSLMNENNRGPDVSVVQPAIVTTAAEQSVVSVPNMPGERSTALNATKIAFNAIKSTPFAIFSGTLELKPELASSGRTFALRPEAIKTDFKYPFSANVPQQPNYAPPEITAFHGFGRDTNARAKI